MSPDKQDIIVYGAPWCRDCRVSKAILEDQNVPFTDKDIGADPAANEEFLQMIGDGPHSIPRILFRREDGATEGMVIIDTLVEPAPAELMEALQAHGYLSAAGE